MYARTLLLLLGVFLLLAAPVLAKDADGDDEPKVAVATAKEAAHELQVFERDFDTVDIDFKLDAVIRLSKCVHKDVAIRLLKVLFTDRDPYIQAEAGKGLQNQIPFADLIGKKVIKLLEDDETDPKILAGLVETIGVLKYTRAWEIITELIAHDDDAVVVACFHVLRDWKELRAWREIQMFWETYPDEGRWQTGSVTVDTGADTATEQRLAKAKWQAKYGGKAKQRPRPDCVKAMKEAVKAITGEELKKPAEFREWCRAHKQEIKAAERRRD